MRRARRGGWVLIGATALALGCGAGASGAVVRAVERPIVPDGAVDEAAEVQVEAPVVLTMDARLRAAEVLATPAARQVLATARDLIEREVVVVRGSCWDYANAVFERAGFAAGRARQTVFRGGKKGPYAELDQIRPGDWLYYVNHSYGEVPHSAIFVDWEDRAAGLGLMISYVGAKRRRPGRYEAYDLRSVYRIVRPVMPDPPVAGEATAPGPAS
ncbi:MAG: hypothetical protein H6704_29365 [Myxococcales bacterium]|nr:hypothetical protein [Myxococcales bacterium]